MDIHATTSFRKEIFDGLSDEEKNNLARREIAHLISNEIMKNFKPYLFEANKEYVKYRIDLDVNKLIRGRRNGHT